MNNPILKIATMSVLAVTIALPATSMAQSRRELDHRQKMKNQWRNVGIGSAALGVFGLVKGDRNLALLGAAGAGYGAYRYEQDRRSQRRLEDSRRYGYSSGRGHYTNRYRSYEQIRRHGRGLALGHYKHWH